jgi:hypothetical protein
VSSVLTEFRESHNDTGIEGYVDDIIAIVQNCTLPTFSLQSSNLGHPASTIAIRIER